MKIRISKSALAQASSQVARHVSAKVATPEEGGMLLETFSNNDNNYLRLVGSDGQATGKAVIAVDVTDAGKILVEGNLFAELIRDLPNGDITLETTEGDAELKISAGRGVYKLPLMDVDSYPKLPNMPEEAGRIDGSLFAAAVTQVARAASKELEKLQGIRVEVSKDTMTLVATDGYRLALCTIPWTGQDISSSAYVSARTLTAAVNQFSRAGEVRVALEPGASSYFGLASADSAVIVQQSEDTFPPNYRKLLVESFTSTAVVELASLIETAKRISKFATDASPAKFSLKKDTLTISGTSRGSGSEDVDIAYDGEEFDISFNPNFLIEGLNALGTEKATIGFNGPEKAATLKAQGGSSDFTYLVMPVRG